MTTTAKTEGFYNFTSTCTAFVNDIRVVKPKNGKQKDAFVSVKICILEGERDEPTKSYADLIVRGEQAKAIIRHFKNDWPSFGQQNGWFAGLRIGSLYAKTYNSKDGTVQATLGGRLLKFTYLKIGDTVVDLDAFEVDTTDAQASQASAPVQQAPNQAA